MAHQPMWHTVVILTAVTHCFLRLFDSRFLFKFQLSCLFHQLRHVIDYGWTVRCHRQVSTDRHSTENHGFAFYERFELLSVLCLGNHSVGFFRLTLLLCGYHHTRYGLRRWELSYVSGAFYWALAWQVDVTDAVGRIRVKRVLVYFFDKVERESFYFLLVSLL